MPTTSDRLPNAPAIIEGEPESEPREIPPVAPLPEVEPHSVAVVWSDDILNRAVIADRLWRDRLLRGYRLLETVGALLWREVKVIKPDAALGSTGALQRFHKDPYLQAVQALSEEQASVWAVDAFGFSETAAPSFPGMAEVARWYVASARCAMQTLLAGEATRAFSLAGGQPHAHAARADSGDIFNDVLFTLMDARSAGKRVAFLNLEAEHPVIIQQHFYDDPDLLFLSLHEGPQFHYPGTGAWGEVGEGRGKGFNVNVPLPPGAGDAEYGWVFEQVVEPLLTRFAPDIVVLLAGSSAHVAEPLAHLRLTTIGYQALIERVTRLARRLLLLGGGGSSADVSARLWAIALGALTGRSAALPRNLPADYTSKWGGGRLHDEPPARPFPDDARLRGRAHARECVPPAAPAFPALAAPDAGRSCPLCGRTRRDRAAAACGRCVRCLPTVSGGDAARPVGGGARPPARERRPCRAAPGEPEAGAPPAEAAPQARARGARRAPRGNDGGRAATGGAGSSPQKEKAPTRGRQETRQTVGGRRAQGAQAGRQGALVDEPVRSGAEPP